jgi:predicted dinucleotide-binding enzyme
MRSSRLDHGPAGRNGQQPIAVTATMTTVGLIGSGHIGSTVARLAVDAGHEVVLSNSRGPETLQDLVDELGPHARAATPLEAAQAGDLVVLTIPLKAVPDVDAEPLRGKVVIDTCNYYPRRDGQIPAIDDGSTTSSAWVQAALPGARVVKGFNNIHFSHLRDLARAHGAADRAVLVIAGDDVEAKGEVTAFLDSIGYDALDAGTLADSWRFEPDTPAYGAPYNSDDSGTWPPPPGSGRAPTADEMRTAVAAATR